MYLRSTPRRNKDASEVRYLQLAHNVWDPQKRRSTVQVVYNFGREDAANREALQRLAASVTRFLDPDAALAAARWISEDVLVTGLDTASDDACYRAMDWLLEIRDDLERRVFDNLADLLNLEVDLLFFDTTSTYFAIEDEDEPVARDSSGNPLAGGNAGSGEEGGRRDPAGFRTWGKSKDHRDDLPQVIIGMAVTRDGIPVRVWCWPGNTADSALIRQVKQDMREWVLGKVIWVADRGFSSARNRRVLQQGAAGYIIGEKL